MPTELTLLQRQAIGKMLRTITDTHPIEWRHWLLKTLEDWELLPDSDLLLGQDWRTLANLPEFIKRTICQTIIMGWNQHHDLKTLYDAIIFIIGHNVCGPSEYYFMHLVYNSLSYFIKCRGDNERSLFIEQYNEIYFSIRSIIVLEEEELNTSLPWIDIALNKIHKSHMIVIIPWIISMDNIINTKPAQRLLEEDILPIICNEFAKRYCSQIYSAFEVRFKRHTRTFAPTIFLTNLQYSDCH